MHVLSCNIFSFLPHLDTTTSTIVLTYVDFNNLKITLIMTFIKNLNATYKKYVLGSLRKDI
jgi:hypothetical protein